MMNEGYDVLSYEPDNCRVRWLGYFDLLGTCELIRAGKTAAVFLAYQDALKELNRSKELQAEVNHAWFSDTFILFTEDASLASFSAIERRCRWFVSSLLLREIPVRGSMSCGELYIDHSNSLYVGPALLEAYEWGENQDWIGYLLCPSSTTQLTNLSLSRVLHYVQYEIPIKKETETSVSDISACVLGNWLPRNRNGQNALLGKLKQMRAIQSDPRVLSKYDRTIDFILKQERKS